MGNNGVCSGSDLRMVGVTSRGVGVVGAVTLNLRDVLAIRCNCSARKNLGFAAIA